MFVGPLIRKVIKPCRGGTSLLVVGVVVGFLATGCSQHPSTPHPEKHALAPEFREGKGLFLPDETKQAIGLEIVDVIETNLSSTIPIPVQVYREAPRADMVPVSTGEGAPRAMATGFLKAEQARPLQAGQAVMLETTSLSVQSLPGRLARIEEATQSAIGQVEVLIEIADVERRLRIGSLLEATITSDRTEQVTAIPRSALLTTATGTYAYVVNGEHLFRTPVVTGAKSGEFVEIKEGLYAGDRVASEPVMTLWLTELQFTKAGQSCTHGH